MCRCDPDCAEDFHTFGKKIMISVVLRLAATVSDYVGSDIVLELYACAQDLGTHMCMCVDD